ncbi:MAG: hypothetical protein AAF799_20755 [Myxococcota bacterium]
MRSWAAGLPDSEPARIAALADRVQGDSDEDAIMAARALAMTGTADARIALQPALDLPVRSPEVIAKIHAAWSQYAPR